MRLHDEFTPRGKLMHINGALKGFRVMGCTRFKKLWEVTPKRSQLELSLLHVTHLLVVLSIPTKYESNRLKNNGNTTLKKG